MYLLVVVNDVDVNNELGREKNIGRGNGTSDASSREHFPPPLPKEMMHEHLFQLLSGFIRHALSFSGSAILRRGYAGFDQTLQANIRVRPRRRHVDGTGAHE